MKTHFKKLRNPDYIGSWDLADENGVFHPKTLTISNVKKQMVFDGKGGQEECVVIHFQEAKPMVANATNLKTISWLLSSPFIEDWIGQQITLKVEQVKAFGEYHDALRVMRQKLEHKKVVLTPQEQEIINAIQDFKTRSELKTYGSTLKDEQKTENVRLAYQNKIKTLPKENE